VLNFLEFNKTEDLTLIGGELEIEDLPDIHLGDYMKRLRLQCLAGYRLHDTVKNLPNSLKSFEVVLCDQFSPSDLENAVFSLKNCQNL